MDNSLFSWHSGGDMMDEMDEMPGKFRRMRRVRQEKKQKGAAEQIAVGLVATIGFGACFYFFPGQWWFIFPMIFVGLMPLASGIAGLFTRKSSVPGKASARNDSVAMEKEILHVVSDLRGTVTVLQVAKATSLSIEESQKTLDGFVKKGFATLEVDSAGLIRYEFPEFQGQALPER